MPRKIFIALIALIAWLAVILQYCLIMQNGRGSGLEITIRFFSFFTILTNTLVAICFSALLSGRSRFFERAHTLTAITIYILVVGAIYNTVLRFIWEPQGLQKFVDELLHSVVPALVIIYWFVFVPGRQLHLQKTIAWLIYPAIYCVYILIRGSIVHEYPYPFVDVNLLGAKQVAANCALLCLVFAALSILFVAMDKWMKR